MAERCGVVIVTYESHDVVGGLLDSLAEHEPEVPVVIVDDSSPSGPPEAGHASVLVTDSNRGYAAASNLGAAALSKEKGVTTIAFLNPDVRLAGPSLTELCGRMAKRPDVGVATGPIVTESGQRIPSAWGPTSVRRALAFGAGLDNIRLRSAAGATMGPRISTSDASTLVDEMRVEGHVIGGTMLVRRACFDELGGFDEHFFLYWEDADLCRRAREAGWQIRLLPCTPIVHTESDVSSDGVDADDRWEWFVEGASRFGAKHLVPGQAKQLDAALALGRRLRTLRERG